MMGNSILIQKRHKIQIGHPERIAILLVGCGGTGSFAALNLARFAASNPQLKVELTFVDFDTVEDQNIGRQYFCPADVGQPKARTLATRLNLAFGLQIRPVVSRFDGGMLSKYMPMHHPGGRLLLVVGCVDTPAARQSIAAAMATYMEESVLHGKPAWWLDAGNDETTGQILIGNTLNEQPLLTKFGECVGLPLPSLQEPKLVEPAPIRAAPEPDLSCAELTALGAQARPINYMAAAWLDVYIERLLISHDLDMMSTTFNQRLGLVTTVPIGKGLVIEGDVDLSDYRPEHLPQLGLEPLPDQVEVDACPGCGGVLVRGEDMVEQVMNDIIFCPACGWQDTVEAFEGLELEFANGEWRMAN